MDESSGDDETCSETKSSEVPTSKAAKGAVIESDSEDSKTLEYQKEAVVNVRHHACLVILVKPTLYVKFPNGIGDVHV